MISIIFLRVWKEKLAQSFGLHMLSKYEQVSQKEQNDTFHKGILSIGIPRELLREIFETIEPAMRMKAGINVIHVSFRTCCITLLIVRRNVA